MECSITIFTSIYQKLLSEKLELIVYYSDYFINAKNLELKFYSYPILIY